MNEYQVVNGTSYHKDTLPEVIKVLETARANKTRLVFDYGDKGKTWLEEFGREGYIGQSAGIVKIPLLVYNNRSLGGGVLLDHCIHRIRTAKGKRELFRHKDFTQPVFEEKEDMVYVNGEAYARFDSTAKAARWIKRMQ